MKMFKFMFIGLSFILMTSCSETFPEEDIATNVEIESRKDDKPKSCWWCISEDILGALEGGAVGSAAGPMGAAVGAAVVGAYRSVKEHESQKDKSKPVSGDYLDELNAQYELEQGQNDWNYVGIKHNELLHLMIMNNSSLESTEDYYDIMMENISSDPFFEEFVETQEFKNAVLEAMDNEVSVSENYNELIEAFQSEGLIGNQEEFMQFINENTAVYQEDQVALQTLATAYHTWYFWQKL